MLVYFKRSDINQSVNQAKYSLTSEFYNSSVKKWLKDNVIEMYSIHNKGKSVVSEGFIRNLNAKIYKYMTSISKNVYMIN